MAVFWVVALCSLVEVYQHFRGPCYLHHQGDEFTQQGPLKRGRLHSATIQKTAIFILATVKTSNPTYLPLCSRKEVIEPSCAVSCHYRN
jgi:hypothetical protein